MNSSVASDMSTLLAEVLFDAGRAKNPFWKSRADKVLKEYHRLVESPKTLKIPVGIGRNNPI